MKRKLLVSLLIIVLLSCSLAVYAEDEEMSEEEKLKKVRWEILDKYDFEAIEAWYMAQRFIRKIENRKHINDSAFGIVSFERLNKVDDIDKIEEMDVYITLTTFNYRSENAPKGPRGVGTVWLRKLEDEDKWELYDYDATLWGG